LYAFETVAADTPTSAATSFTVARRFENPRFPLLTPTG
jgi:hypothetical protein